MLKKKYSNNQIEKFFNKLKIFKLGYSWGGFESLMIPAYPEQHRTATKWKTDGQLLRIHAGLEDIDDLKSDLEDGFARFNR
mgnify:CR=1 FL=1